METAAATGGTETEWAAALGALLMVLNILSFFATRREVDELKKRNAEDKEDLKAQLVELKNKIQHSEQETDKKREKLHNRINRMVAVQSMIAGRMGVSLSKHEMEIERMVEQLNAEDEE